ncbi:MAG: nicotinate (nicotinamide) nucleotide adenylyltransferase [Planctomyces sp.]|nr:nicotinate (nicotinamide) nucleotide adenylyltransferase [Planctomyces sp.]
MRLGILGGTFDPVHYGHLLMAEICRQELQLERVHLLPAGNPPHKPGRKIADGHSRADMLSFGVSGMPEFVVDRRELRRQGPSFTVDTLLEFQREFPDAERYLIIGADSLRDFLTWKSPERIAELATIVVCNRPGLPHPSLEQIEEWVGNSISKSVVLVSMPGTDLSSTDLRDRIRSGRSIRFMTPRAVEAFIQQHRLYLD